MGMREKLFELIRKNPTCIESGANSCSDCQYGSSEDCCSECLADHLMANNVVPVVRCKDCLYRNEYGDCTHKWWMDAEGWYKYVGDDDFCSYGERKDNDST